MTAFIGRGYKVSGKVRQKKKTGKITQKIRYYASYSRGDAVKFNTKIGQHWAIENNLHWSLDVLFNEDTLLKKFGNSAINFSIVKDGLSFFGEREIHQWPNDQNG